MEYDLISKKELLDLAGISYGQLYRWKRKNLIPEDWFVRKSTFTGQETFFPKDKILPRIEKIKNMKDDLSLNDLAGVFSPNWKEISLGKDEIIERNIVAKSTLDFFDEQHGETQVLDFEKILYVYVLEKVLHSGDISIDEGGILLSFLEENYRNFKDKSCVDDC